MTTPYNYQTSNYPAGAMQYYSAAPTTFSNSAIALGGVGAMIGAVGATAACVPQVRGQQMTNGEAAMFVAKEAAGTGLATAAGGVAVRAIGLGGIAGLLGMFAVATGVKYFWNQAMESREAAAQEQAKPEQKPKAKKAAAKKK